jgi:hypothetical protein
MIDINDLVKIQSLINAKGQELFLELKQELNKIDVDLVTHITNNCLDRISKIPSEKLDTSKKIYSTQDHKNKKYVRNSECWASDLDLTCISPWNSTGNNTRAGTAITKYHIIYANHYPINIGSTVRFISKNNEIIDRKLIKSASVDKTDISVGLLDTALPDSIKPAKVLPKFYRDYIAINFNHIIELNDGTLLKSFPALCLDYEEKAIINEVVSINNFVSCGKSSGLLQKYNEIIIAGDSGNPCFAIIDNELVLLTTWLYGNYGTGPFISGDTWNSTEQKLKSNLKEIQNLLTNSLLPNNDSQFLKDSTLNYCDLWRFRKVSP